MNMETPNNQQIVLVRVSNLGEMFEKLYFFSVKILTFFFNLTFKIYSILQMLTEFLCRLGTILIYLRYIKEPN